MIGFTAPAPAQPELPDECDLYTYKAIITRVVDGDTVVADIESGVQHLAAQ